MKFETSVLLQRDLKIILNNNENEKKSICSSFKDADDGIHVIYQRDVCPGSHVRQAAGMAGNSVC